ncbi:MAG: helix-turn-helix domain-containing protein [Longibaculum sp.]
MSFGERLHELRKEKQISQEELADIIGVSRQTISRWESSTTSPDLISLEKLCQYFELSYDELLEKKPVHKKSYFYYFSVLFFISLCIISFFLPNSQEDFAGSALVITPAGFCLCIGVVGLLFLLLHVIKNQRK